MRIVDCTQGEADWFTARLGKVTASEADALITPEFATKTGEGPKTYLAKKVAESMLKTPVDGFSSFETEYGAMMEMEARKWVAFEFPESVEQVGFVEHEDGRCGSSPDGLMGEDGGLELKCPQPTNHIKYLLAGVLPKEYAVQVHFNLYVTGRKWWRFVSYRRGLPQFVVKVERDQEKCDKIAAALSTFYTAFDAAINQIKKHK